MGPLLFSIYINDLVNIHNGIDFFIYADDTAVFFKHRDLNVLQCIINAALPKISNWLPANYLSMLRIPSINYIQIAVISSVNVAINGNAIERKDTVKYLGVLIDDNLKFNSHIDTVTNIVSRNIDMMCRVRHMFKVNKCFAYTMQSYSRT